LYLARRDISEFESSQPSQTVRSLKARDHLGMVGGIISESWAARLRVAISNRRLIACDDKGVTFKALRCSAAGNSFGRRKMPGPEWI
jgi:hypothetical protein